MDELYELISKSRITTIGFTSEFEDDKDKIISKLSPYVLGVLNGENFKSTIRDIKLDNIINNTKHDYILAFQSKSDTMMRKNLDSIRSQIGYKLIVECPMYKSFSGDDPMTLVGGSSPIYCSDLVILIYNNQAHIVKNRFSENKVINLTK